MIGKKDNRRRFLSLAASLASLNGCRNGQKMTDAGEHMRPYGDRSPHETSVRVIRELTRSPGTGSSRTPLQELHGTITPSSLHFERHHSGAPSIDPSKHRLLIHGLVYRPLSFGMDDIRRFPSVSRICFLECSGNSVGDQGNDPPATVQQSHGLLSCTEWTGVPLRVLLEEAGVRPEGKWVIAEGSDSSRMSRSIPMEKALEDTLVVYGQNGEALRPEQGYPLRLILPGWEGNMNVKWIHRLLVADQPAMSVKETAQYTELMPDGKAHIFTFVMEVRSVITRPSGGQKLLFGPGQYDISGLAWSGMGKVKRVEVSTDGGRKWSDAELQVPVLSQAVTRFHFPWRWDGSETFLASRCTDEAGFTQPTRDEFIEIHGLRSGYHYNAIKRWHVHPDGNITSV